MRGVSRRDGEADSSLAAACGQEDALRCLLRSHACPRRQDAQGMTALMWASKQGYEQLIPFLLDAPNAALVGKSTPTRCQRNRCVHLTR